MTKTELIKFLEPFDDDIIIVKREGNHIFEEIVVEYEIANESVSELGISIQYGIVVIK